MVNIRGKCKSCGDSFVRVANQLRGKVKCPACFSVLSSEEYTVKQFTEEEIAARKAQIKQEMKIRAEKPWETEVENGLIKLPTELQESSRQMLRDLIAKYENTADEEYTFYAETMAQILIYVGGKNNG